MRRVPRGARASRTYSRSRWPGRFPPTTRKAIWAAATEELRASLPPATFELWIEPLEAVAVQGTDARAERPGPGPPLGRAPLRADAISRRSPPTRRSSPASRFTDSRVRRARPRRRTRATRCRPRSTPRSHLRQLRDRARQPPRPRRRARRAPSFPGEAYNPLFLHGPPGLGKTHLLGAIAEYLARNHPELNVHQTTAERFTTEFVAALRHDGPERFKQRYRELDALLIDDVQVLEGKARTEEEFVHTFNALFAAGKQIVLCGDRPPEALAQLAERLRDRFEWGLTVELEPPDLRTRIALLWRMAARSAPELPDPAALREIAGRVPGNVRLLEGAMTRVVAMSSVLSEPITTPAGAHRRSSRRRRARAARPAAPPQRRRDPGRGRCVLGVPAGGAPLAPADPARRSGPPARDVPLARADLALPGPDRPRVRPRPHHRPPRHPHRLQAPRAGLRDRRGRPQDPCAAWGQPATPASAPTAPSTAQPDDPQA